MPNFAMFDCSNDPYDHMLHCNQEMTLNSNNDHLLCKVFQASLRGPTLAYFHKLPCNSINLFNELWTSLSIFARYGRRGTLALCGLL